MSKWLDGKKEFSVVGGKEGMRDTLRLTFLTPASAFYTHYLDSSPSLF